MKRQILERARSAVEGFLHQHCANTTLGVLSVTPASGRTFANELECRGM